VAAALSCRGARSGGAVAEERRRVWSSREGGLRPTGPSAIGRAGPRGAHRGLGSIGDAAQGGWRRGPSGGDGRRSWGRLLQGSSGLLIPTGRLGVFLRRCHGGQGGPGIAGGEKSQGRDVAPTAGLGQIPATASVEIEAGGHGKLPGIEGKLPGVWLGLRCGGAAGPRRGRRFGVAEQRGDGAGARWQLRVLGLESQEVGGSYL
jgi:hypothetical protein